MLRTHCQTSGWSLTAQSPYNNIARTCIEAMSAVFGGTQSLHTNALDEAIALPTPFSARIARNTQLLLQLETGITKTIDPFGGSFSIEMLTQELYLKAKKHIDEINAYGGMIKAIEAGIPKMRIEAAATQRQANIDAGIDVIVGVNAYISDNEVNIDILDIDNKKIRAQQIARIHQTKLERNNTVVQQSLEKLEAGAKSHNNLLELCIDAARANATLGEMSSAIEKVFGRYKATTQSVSGVFLNAMKDNDTFIKARKLSDEFASIAGRRARILVSKVGQDGHDRGAKIIATGFADIGFDVDISPLFLTAEEVVSQALENDVHIIGISSLAAGHKTLLPQIIKLLSSHNRRDIMVVCGGVIPKQDYDFLYKEGVVGIYGPGFPVAKAAIEILELLIEGYSI